MYLHSRRLFVNFAQIFMKKLALLLCIAATTLISCSKDDDSKPAVDFAIDGIRDVKIDESATSNILPLIISRGTTSNQEAVTLSTSGLPAGVTATFDPASGTPNFSTILTFSYDYSGTGGTQPVKIIGTTASGKKEYSLNMTLPATLTNGWVLDGMRYETDYFAYNNTSGGSVINAQATNGNDIAFAFQYGTTLPKSKATYKVVEYPRAADEVSVRADDEFNYYNSTDGAGGTVTVDYQNGKWSVRATGIELSRTVGSTTVKKKLTAVIAEK